MFTRTFLYAHFEGNKRKPLTKCIGEELESVDLGKMEFDAESERAPELKQYWGILKAFNAFAVSTRIADLADSIAEVTLSSRGKKHDTEGLAAR